MSTTAKIALVIGFVLAIVMLLPLMGEPGAKPGADGQLLGIGTLTPVLALTPSAEEMD